MAHPLETEEDLVTARLTVKNLTLEDSALDFHLEASNQYSEQPTKYKFYLNFEPKVGRGSKSHRV